MAAIVAQPDCFMYDDFFVLSMDFTLILSLKSNI